MASPKIKSSTSSANSQAGSLLSSSVSSSGQADIFNDLFDKMHVEEMNAQADAGKEQSNQNQNDQNIKTKSSEKTDETSEVKESKKADDEDELSVEEKKELDEIDNYKMSMEELAKQLNVVLTAAPQMQVSDQNRFQNVKVVLKSDNESAADLKTALEGIDPKLLRLVDVQTLDNQLKKLMNNSEVLDVAAPSNVPDMSANLSAMAGAADQATLMDSQNLDLAADTQAAVFTDAPVIELNVDDDSEDVVLDLKEIELDLSAEDETFDADLQKLSKNSELNLSTAHQVKAFAGEADKALQSGANQETFIPSGESKSDVAVSASPTQVNLSQAGSVSTPKEPAKLSLPQMHKVKQQVESVVLELSRNGKSDSTRIQMDPENLGRIDIKIEMSKDEKTVSAEIITDNPEAKEAILQHIPQIKAALASENLMLDYFSAKHDDRHFQSAQGQQADAQDQSGRRNTHSGTRSEVDQAEADQLKGVIAKRLNSDSLINITV